MTVDDLKSIAAFGGGLDISASRFTVDQLTSIASFGKNKGARLILGDVQHLSTNDMKSIAAFGDGTVVFVL